MAEMNSGGMEGLEGDEGLKGLTQALGELLGGLGENFGMDPSVYMFVNRKQEANSRIFYKGKEARRVSKM